MNVSNASLMPGLEIKSWPQKRDRAQNSAQPLFKKKKQNKKNLPLNSRRGRKWGYRCKVAFPCEQIFSKVSLKKKEWSQIWMCSWIPGCLCCSSSLTLAAAAVLQLPTLALCFSSAGEIILPLPAPAQCYPSPSQQDGQKSRRKWKREDKEAAVSWACLYAARMPVCVSLYHTASHRSSMQDDKSAPTQRLLYFPGSKSNLNNPSTSKLHS